MQRSREGDSVMEDGEEDGEDDLAAAIALSLALVEHDTMPARENPIACTPDVAAA